MANMDDGVTNLRRFLAYTIASTGALETSTAHFKESAERLGRLEDDADEAGGGLNHELEALGTVLEAGLHAAEDALQELNRAAIEGQGVADDGAHALDAAGAQAEDEAEAALAELADAQARLVAQGFDALDVRLDAMQQELDTEAQAVGQAFDELEASVAAGQTEAEAAWDEAEAELDGATAELAQGATAVEAAADDCVNAFDAEGDAFEQHCADLASEIDVIYDALDAAVVEQGQEWEQHVAHLAQDAAGFAESGTEERVEQPARVVEDEALRALEQEYGAVEDVLDAGSAAAGELEPLTGELARCTVVVAQVAELLNALAG